MIKINIEENLGVRLDHYMVENTEFNRSLVKKMITDKDILVNDNEVKPGYILKKGDVISYNAYEEKDLDLTPVDLKLDIVFEDEHILVINKPKGLVVHPSKTHTEDTLVHGLLYEMEKLSDVNGTYRPGIIHRIDKDTSGLLIVAKTNEAHQILSEDLSHHDINRTYLAIVYGKFEETKGYINAPIGRDPKDRLKNTVISTGKRAVTHFEVLETYEKFSLVKCNLETGRTHQIRVHLAYIKHPIVGDPLYGFRPLLVDDGQMLHAYEISFIHPITKKAMTFNAPLPDSFNNFLSKLK